jgi:uncharacterized RDD family membrane protein YckC
MSGWYLKRGTTEVGPGSDDQVRAAFKKGSLSLESLVRKDGQKDWVALKDSGLLNDEDKNPFIVDGKVEKPTGDKPGAPNQPQVDNKPLIHPDMFKEKPRYGRRSPPVYAPIADRFLAGFIDLIMLWVVTAIFFEIFGSFLFISTRLTTYLMLTYVIRLIIYGGYFVFWQHEWGYTIGRKVMKIHVEMADRSRPDTKTFLVRYLGSLTSGLMLGLGYFIAFSDPKHQTLHDRLAGTIVVKD